MKVERQQNSIRLIPESEWDKTQLKDLAKNGIESLEFKDSWNQKGYLQINYKIHPWDK